MVKIIKKIKIKFNNLLKEISYNFGLTYCLGKPSIFVIESTNKCNIKCIMCPRTTMMKRKIGDMDFSLFKKIIDNGHKYTDFLWLHNFGEPVLNPKIFEMIKYCKAKDIKVGLSLNGLTLTKTIGKKLLECGPDLLIFSFDGFSKKTYEKYRQGSNFEVVKKNILNFLKMKKGGGYKLPFIQIKIIKMKDTLNEIEDFKKEWEGKVDEVIVTNFVDWAGQITNEENVSDAIIKEQEYPCKFFWISLVVLWDGRVVPCCKDCDAKMVLGNLNNQTIDEIWNGEKMREIRKQQIKHNFKNPLCYNCDEAIGKPSLLFLFKNFKEKALKIIKS